MGIEELSPWHTGVAVSSPGESGARSPEPVGWAAEKRFGSDLSGFLRDLLEAILLAVLLALFVRTYLVQVFRIPSASMAPDLRVGDHLLVNRFVFAPSQFAWERHWLPLRRVERGDVVVFRYPRDPRRHFVKRCVALAGDEVRISAKQLLVDGTMVNEKGYAYFSDPRVYPDSPLLDDYYRRRDNLGPLAVPQGSLFVLGDNRDISDDSRFWGAIPERMVRGRPLLVLWSVAAGPDAESAGKGASSPRAVPNASWPSLRWSRCLRPVR